MRLVDKENHHQFPYYQITLDLRRMDIAPSILSHFKAAFLDLLPCVYTQNDSASLGLTVWMKRQAGCLLSDVMVTVRPVPLPAMLSRCHAMWAEAGA